LTLRVYAHALREEEKDLSFLDLGGTKRHPRGTEVENVLGRKKPLRVTPRRGSRFLEHEAGLEAAEALAVASSATAPPLFSPEPIKSGHFDQ
jgi:hypothetical protein